MNWHWQSYINSKNEWSLVFDDGRYSDEMARVERKYINGRIGYIATATKEVATFKTLTDAKIFCEKVFGLHITKRTKKIPSPFGL